MRFTTCLSVWLLVLVLLHVAAQTDDCGTPDPATTTIVADQLFSSNDGAPTTIIDWILFPFRFLASLFFGQSDTFEEYQLVNVPLVYHVMTNQDNGGVASPSLTNDQRDYATHITNQMYRIYDKQTRQTIQFASFVIEGTLFHDIALTGDCRSMNEDDMASVVQTVQDWQFKLHVIVCESNQMSGIASFPETYKPTSPLHNLVRMDYRAFACHDDHGNFLCEPSANGQNSSHTRWWRTRSVVVAHEFGHLFGLRHTHQGGCLGNDFVDDTPTQNVQASESCPGLLPYHRDRDWFNVSWTPSEQATSVGINDATCSGDAVCGETCASCCTALDGSNSDCPKFATEFEVVTEDVYNFPHCCNDPTPLDSCPFQSGIDPLNNVMSYVPDFCQHEFTMGQKLRMMEQIRQYKKYMYCNYANVLDRDMCRNVPCASTASSPTCKTS